MIYDSNFFYFILFLRVKKGNTWKFQNLAVHFGSEMIPLNVKIYRYNTIFSVCFIPFKIQYIMSCWIFRCVEISAALGS